MNKKLLVISLDAFSSDDLAILKTKPHFRALCTKGTLVEGVETLFLSNTYPIHTSIITGRLPKDHGVFDNTRIDPYEPDAHWNWWAHQIQGDSLFTVARQKGLHITNLFWPMCCKANIQQNIPEIIARKGENQVRLMLENSTPWFLLKNYARYGRKVKGALQPNLDDFSVQVMCDVLRRGKSDLATIHFTDTDTQKHLHGIDSAQVLASIERMDVRLGQLVEAANEQYQIVVLSDHGQKDADDYLDLNDLMKAYQLDAFVWFHQSGGSAFAKIMKPMDERLKQRLFELLESHPLIRRFLSEDEMHLSGFDQMCAFGVAAKEGIEFAHANHRHVGIHGLPLDTQDYRVFYLAVGDSILPQVLHGGSLLDLAPLFAHLLQLTPWTMERSLRHDLFERNMNDVALDATMEAKRETYED